MLARPVRSALATLLFTVACGSTLVSSFGCQQPDPEPTPAQTPAETASPTLQVTPTQSLTPTVTATPTQPVTPTATMPPVLTPTPGTPTPTPAGPTPSATPVDNDVDDDGFTDLEGDCDDHDSSVNPDAPETPYDGIDQDCSNGDQTDMDNDGFDSTQVEGGTDCDDTSSTTYPGASEFEDDKDNDCDGQVDEALNTTDDDGDGFSEADGDCDDSAPDRAPGRTDIPYDGVDQDCSGSDQTDVDQDGYAGGATGNDCNDSDATIHPGATEVPYDGVDQDCAGDDLVDQDKDGVEGGPSGTDCDDLDPSRSPLLAETPYDGVDQDCSGTDQTDVDQDGQASTQVAGGTDCNDHDTSIYKGALEVPYDGVDQDCSGADLNDMDQDGHVSLQAGGNDCDDASANTYPGADEFEDDKDNDCDGAIDEDLNTNDDDGDGFSEATGDCDDAESSLYPGASEVPYDGVDQDCSGQDLTDVDQDGFSATQAGGSDCNDGAPEINPSRTDIPYDTIDQDCSGADLVDVDQDGFAAEVTGGDDCDDGSALTHPGASEVPYDAIDQDCNDSDLVDVDQDGFTASQAGGDDCNDSDATIRPGATEICDSIDNNCDTVVDTDAVDRGTWYADADGDTYGDPSHPVLTCTPTLSQVSNSTDCDDSSAISYPGAMEICDEWDNNCDLYVDEGVKTPYFADLDGDNYGNANDLVEACEAPLGYVEDHTDCDDVIPTTNPGADEVCNDVDDDCNDQVDDGVLTSYYLDEDQDGYGVTVEEVQLCEAPIGYVETPGDCDDAHASAHPGGHEVCDAENVDEDCNGSADDADTGVDSVTKTTWYRDSDGDGYGSASVATTTCDQPSGYVTTGTDCNAANAAIHPGATELAGDSVDQNCDGQETCFQDADDDGFRPDTTSTTPSSDKDCLDASEASSSDPTGDCNDTSAAIKPSASELAGDNVDQNCDGVEMCFTDADNDGYRPNASSTTGSADSDCADTSEASSSDPTGDCNDTSAAINPAASELTGDSVDQNCDGQETCFKDADNDGYRPDSTSTTSSTDSDCADAAEGTASDPTGDCNDSNANIWPGATETADGVDQNCNGSVDEGLNQTSCLTLKQNVPTSPSGIYSIDPDGTGSGAPFQVYCDMTTAGGGWTLFTNRRGNTTNVEACGSNLMQFQNATCGSVTAIGYGNSYSLSTSTLMRIAFTQYLMIQYNSSGTADTDDAYILYTSQNLFPNTNAVQQIPVSKVCDINGSNCDTSSVYWKFIGDFWYHSSMCYSGSSYDATYRGNYGLCADGATDSGNAGSYPSSGKYGNREGYDETKLWAHPNTAAAYQERIFVR